MNKKTRKHSALLLLMAPIIAIGSTALVAGTAASAGATPKKLAAPTITIREVAPGAFRFALNGTVVSLKGSSGVFKARIGINRVSEFWAPASYRTLSKISVIPATARLSASLRTESVTVRLAAGKSAIVTFTNSRFAVVEEPVTAPSNPDPVTPPPSSPSAGTPPPSNPAPGNPTAGGSDPTGTGYIEICKSALDNQVEGTFNFTISGTSVAPSLTLTPASDTSIAPSVCTGAITVPAGTVTVTEGSEAPAYGLYSVTAAPVGNLVASSVDLTAQSANFTVTAGFETTAIFTNFTEENTVKVCKVLNNNLGTLAGTAFNYGVSWTFTPPTQNLAFASYGGSSSVDVVAVASPGQQCAWVPASIPASSVVTITENGTEVSGGAANPSGATGPWVSVSGVTYTPSTFDAATSTTPANEAILTVPPVSDGWADATFWNTPMGSIEVCKYFVAQGSAYNNGTNSATFVVTAGSFTSAPFTVLGGQCSPEMAVPAGTATVDETSAGAGDYYLETITASATLAGEGPTDELLTAGTAVGGTPPVNPASVNVPYGGVASTTEVAFTNGVDPTTFKICKQTADSELVGATFTFYWWYGGASGTTNGIAWSVPAANDESDPVTLTITAVNTPVCSELQLSIPVVNPDGSPNPIRVTEEASTDNVAIADITLSGAGILESTDYTAGDPATPGCLTFDPGIGTGVVTFTNEYVTSPV